MLDIISAGYIEVTATPSAPTGLPPLSAKLQIVQAAAQQTGWAGEVTSSDDAINYQIHGTKQQTLTITWNENVVSLSKWSAEMLGQSPTSPLTISVGGAGKPTDIVRGEARRPPPKRALPAHLANLPFFHTRVLKGMMFL